jgi:hypothetical protein
MTDNRTMTIGGQDYEIHIDDADLVVSPSGADDEQLTERISLDQLSDGARRALDRGDLDDSALRVALEGIVQAAADRGA